MHGQPVSLCILICFACFVFSLFNSLKSVWDASQGESAIMENFNVSLEINGTDKFEFVFR